MSPLPIKYELERSQEDGGKTYFIYKIFDNGTKLLWERCLLRQLAVMRLRKLGVNDKVPTVVTPGVFRRKQ